VTTYFEVFLGFLSTPGDVIELTPVPASIGKNGALSYRKLQALGQDRGHCQEERRARKRSTTDQQAVEEQVAKDAQKARRGCFLGGWMSKLIPCLFEVLISSRGGFFGGPPPPPKSPRAGQPAGRWTRQGYRVRVDSFRSRSCGPPSLDVHGCDPPRFDVIEEAASAHSVRTAVFAGASRCLPLGAKRIAATTPPAPLPTPEPGQKTGATASGRQPESDQDASADSWNELNFYRIVKPCACRPGARVGYRNSGLLSLSRGGRLNCRFGR